MTADRLASWRMTEAGQPLERQEDPLPKPEPGEVLLKVTACGLCHTDFSFLYGGVRPNAPLPLTLGHEIVGQAVAAGPGAEDLVGRTLLVPAVLPCGDCALCRSGRGNVCRRQKMPGNDFHGGFASHFLGPARFLCPVPESLTKLESLSVVADAVGTAYQSVLRAGTAAGDLVVVVGAGGVGTFAVQTARYLGARVVAIDIDEGRLQAIASYIDLPLNAAESSVKEIRGAIADFEGREGGQRHRRKIIECSGTGAGQQTAYSLLTHNASLAVVGFTMQKTELRLSNLMAFDATAFGNWGCLPEHFPEILDLIAGGDLEIEAFVDYHPMRRLNELLADEHHRRRPILIPDF